MDDLPDQGAFVRSFCSSKGGFSLRCSPQPPSPQTVIEILLSSSMAMNCSLQRASSSSLNSDGAIQEIEDWSDESDEK